MKKLLSFKCTIIFALAVFGSFILSAQEKDDIKVSGNFQDKELSLVLLDLNINYRIQFEYDPADIKGIKISKSFGKLPLQDALSVLFSGTGLQFSIEPGRKVKLVKGGPETLQKQRLEPSTHEPEQKDFTLQGVVKDQFTGERLPFTSVLVTSTLNGTSSNVDGYFTLFNVPSDTVMLEVQYLGYQTKWFRLNPEIAKGEIVINLEPINQQLQEVIVIAQQEEQMMKASTGISQIGISPVQVATLPSFGEKDIFRSLQLLPGVSGTNESSSGLYVRGGTPDQNLVLFDGFTVYHVDHLFGFFSAFNAKAIKDVQLHKGGFDAKFGGRISSVVELTGKDGNSEQFNAGAGISLLSYNGFVEAPFAKQKGTFLLAARRSFQSKFYSNLFDSFTESNNTVANNLPSGGRRFFGQQEIQPNSYFYDLNSKLVFRPSKMDVFALSFYNGQDNLDNSRNFDNSSFGGVFGRPNNNGDFTFNSQNTDLTKWGNYGGSAKWSRRWTESLYSNSNLSFSNYYSERDRNDQTTITRSDSSFVRSNGAYEYNDLKDFTFKLDNEWKLHPNHQLEFGVQSTFNDIKYQYTQNDTTSVLNKLDKGWTNAFYVQDKFTISDKLLLRGGIRTTLYGVNNQIYLEPRLSFSYFLSDLIKIKGAWGLYNQFATRIVREDIQQGSRDFWLLADGQNVPVSSAQHFILGAAYESKDYLFDVEGYYKNLDGLSEYTSRFVPTGFGPGRGLNYEEFFYQGTGKAKGVEFLLQKKTGLLTGWVGYTLSQVKYDFDAFGDQPFFANQDQTHELKMVASYKLNRLTLSSTFIYGTGKPYTAPTGYYELGLLDGNTADFFEVSAKNALRLPDYHRFDLAATFNFMLGPTKADAGISLFNIYNRKNVWYKEYQVIEGELIETNVNLLDFTPSLFFNWTLK